MTCLRRFLSWPRLVALAAAFVLVVAAPDAVGAQSGDPPDNEDCRAPERGELLWAFTERGVLANVYNEAGRRTRVSAATGLAIPFDEFAVSRDAGLPPEVQLTYWGLNLRLICATDSPEEAAGQLRFAGVLRPDGTVALEEARACRIWIAPAGRDSLVDDVKRSEVGAALVREMQRVLASFGVSAQTCVPEGRFASADLMVWGRENPDPPFGSARYEAGSFLVDAGNSDGAADESAESIAPVQLPNSGSGGLAPGREGSGVLKWLAVLSVAVLASAGGILLRPRRTRREP